MFNRAINISSKRSSMILLIVILLSFVINPIFNLISNKIIGIDLQLSANGITFIIVLVLKVIALLFSMIYLFRDDLESNHEKIAYRAINIFVSLLILYYHLFNIILFKDQSYIVFGLFIFSVNILSVVLILWRVNHNIQLNENLLTFENKFKKIDILSILLIINLIYLFHFVTTINNFSNIPLIIYNLVTCLLVTFIPLLFLNSLTVLTRFVYDHITI